MISEAPYLVPIYCAWCSVGGSNVVRSRCGLGVRVVAVVYLRGMYADVWMWRLVVMLCCLKEDKVRSRYAVLVPHVGI